MITLKELNPSGAKTTPEQDTNLLILLMKIGKVRLAYGKSMLVTSGLRTLADHLRIYAAKGITDQSKIPMKSMHLIGGAVDIADADGSLMKWCKDNVAILEDAGLWCEEGTKGWVHFQISPPRSGKRFFNP